MARNSFRRPLAILALVLGLGLVGAVVYRPWEASGAASAPIIGVVHQTEIRIAPEINARVDSFRVAAGQTVRKGDVLVTLSSPDLAAAVEQAKAEPRLSERQPGQCRMPASARKKSTRRRRTFGSPTPISRSRSNSTNAPRNSRPRISRASSNWTRATEALGSAEAELSQVQAAYAQSKAGPTKEERAIADAQVAYAEATLADIEAKLDKTTLSASVDGVVTLLVAEPGEVVSPGQPVLTIAPANERWFTFTIRENLLSGLTVGSPVRLLAANGDRIDAKVTELRPLGEFAVWRAARAVGDHDLNSFLLRADPDQEVRSVEPGMTVWIDRGSSN